MVNRTRYQRADFVIKHDYSKESDADLTKKVIKALVINRLKANKPVVIFVGGDSGEGKSFGVLKLQETILELQGFNLIDYIDDVNIYTPIEYPEKLDALLHNIDLKKINLLAVHESRDLIRAKNWQSFLTQAVADVNAQSRSLKRLCFFIISQFIRDITVDVRYTLNYYVIVKRPMHGRARLYISVIWKDDRDLDNPKIRKRRLSGYVVSPSGRYRRYTPEYLELSKPSEAVVASFEAAEKIAKADIIRGKLDRLIKEMKSEANIQGRKVDSLVDWYSKNTDQLSIIGSLRRGRWRLNREFRDVHDLSKGEADKFELLLNERLKGFGDVVE
ncbi:MAG: hypothetical protein US97_C0007G0010 [Microgenomates group bacterium GW2011_GWF1_38_5]|nr:MAG: hypothetical protein US97_C0007G0010 [Microgenomates group bacterium GW2011_GWF1_38_5]